MIITIIHTSALKFYSTGEIGGVNKMEYKIALIPGDGIGPEIVAEAKKVLDRVCEKYSHKFSYTEVLLGGHPLMLTEYLLQRKPLPRQKLLM